MTNFGKRIVIAFIAFSDLAQILQELADEAGLPALLDDATS